MKNRKWYLVVDDQGTFHATFVKGPFQTPAEAGAYIAKEVELILEGSKEEDRENDIRYFEFTVQALAKREATQMGEYGIEVPE